MSAYGKVVHFEEQGNEVGKSQSVGTNKQIMQAYLLGKLGFEGFLWSKSLQSSFWLYLMKHFSVFYKHCFSLNTLLEHSGYDAGTNPHPLSLKL